MDPAGHTAVAGGDDRERRALLAALLGVYVSCEMPQGVPRTLTGPLRPMSAGTAIDVLRQARGRLGERARRDAAARLAVGAFHENRPDLRLSLASLCGEDMTAAIGDVVGTEPSRPDTVAAAAYDVLLGRAPSPRPLDLPVTRSSIDVRTLMTSVEVSLSGAGTFEALARWMDPRSWTSSPFWLAAEKVIKAGDHFVPDPAQPPLGESWRGYFYEYVAWAHNESVISAFQCVLDARYTVDRVRRTVDLAFSLYRADGSMILTRIAPGGVDIDRGGSHAAPLPPTTGPDAYVIHATKHIRYTDLLTRSTPNQGPDGAGETLNLMAPAIVGMWMNDLMYESVVSWGRGEEPPPHGGGLWP